MNTDIKTFIRENLYNKNGSFMGSIKHSWFEKNNCQYIYDEILERTNFLPLDVSLSHRCQYILNDLTQIKKCKTCEISMPYARIDGKNKREFCSNQCGQLHQDTRRKIKNTTFKKYGVTSLLQKSETYMKKKYGVANASQLEFVQKKKKSNAIKNYGVLSQQKHLTADAVGKLSNIEYLSSTPKSKIYSETRISQSHLSKIFRQHGLDVPRAETEVSDYLHQISPQTIIMKNQRKILQNKFELDIFLPEYNLAIEYNGLYWHSELNDVDKKYHQNKWKHSMEKGINLLQIFENEWIDQGKNDIWKSMISNRLGLNKKIYARNTIVKEITTSQAKKFLSENHLQGYANSSIKFGLFYLDELIQVMTFRRPRFCEKYDYEIIRLATKKYYHVVGGASKLFKAFLKQNQNKSVISYADLRYATGNVYKSMGFQEINITQPNFWVIENWKTVHNRMMFQKHKLKTKLEFFNEEISAWQNLKNNGFNRIWDAGNKVFVYDE